MLIRPLIGFAKYFKDGKTMSFKVIDKRLLKKSTKIWEKISTLMNIKFYNEPVYVDSDKFIKTKIWME